MKISRSQSNLIFLLILVWMVSPCFLPQAEARGGMRAGGGEREGEFAGERGEGFSEEDRSRGTLTEGSEGGRVYQGDSGFDAAQGPNGGVAVRGPEGNVYAGRAAGARVSNLPDTADEIFVGDQTYYVDGDVYYQPCSDSDDDYCVVDAPQ